MSPLGPLRPLIGIAVILLIAWALSRSRRHVPWKSVAIGIGMQFFIAAVFFHIEAARRLLGVVTRVARVLEQASNEGTSFVFGYLGGGDLPFELIDGTSSFVFALQTLPVIVLIGALSALLWHWRVLTVIVRAGSFVVQRAFGLSGAIGVSSVANIFLSMIEAPLLIKPYLSRLTRQELFIVMTGGMATVAGGTAIIISSILQQEPGVFANVVIATLMNVPGAIVMALCLFPMIQSTSTARQMPDLRSPHHSAMDALVSGTADGITIFINVVAMLIVFISLVAIINIGLSLLPGEWTLQSILGYLLAPVAWLIGIPGEELLTAGTLLGTKLAVNEIVAYSLLADLSASLSANTFFILTFALCGFGNIGSVAILIGGLSVMVPERRDDIIRLGFWAVLASFMTNCLTASVAQFVHFWQ